MGGEDAAEDDDSPSIHMDLPKWQSTTLPQKPITRDRYYCCLSKIRLNNVQENL